MKFTNIKQLLINFKGGGLINFPFKHLKEVDIDGDTDEQSGGGSSTPLTKLDTIKNYVNLLYQDYNIEFDIVEETSTKEIEVEDENQNPTGEVVTATQKLYKFVPKTEVPRVYLSGDTTGSISTGANGQLQLHSQNVHGINSENSISKIIFNDTELTIDQLKNYDVIQVGVSNITINDVNVRPSSYETYLESLNWFRNNIAEFAEIPILLLGQPASGNTKMYINSGLIQIQLYLNGNVGIYTQTVYGAIKEKQ